jgi:hypothetical protein
MQLDNWVSTFVAQSNRKLGPGNLESGHQAPRFMTDGFAQAAALSIQAIWADRILPCG